MDRPLPQAAKLKRKAKWIAFSLLGIAIAFGATGVLKRTLSPYLDHSQMIVGVVEKGPVSAVLETTGILEPEQELVLTAPGETRVLSIVRKPGSIVKAGEPVLRLDISTLLLNRDEFAQKIDAKQNERKQAELLFEKLDRQDAAKLELIELDLKYYEAVYTQQKTLSQQGLVSKETLQQALLQLEKKQVERRQVQEERQASRQSQNLRLQGFDLELQLLKKALDGSENLLSRATTQAPIDGVLTWILEGEGATVRSGDPLARIADLSHFKVSATVSDYYVDQLLVGQEALIKLGDNQFHGSVSRVLPEIKNGTLPFEITFTNPSNLALRPQQRVTVFLITSKRENTLRVRRSAALAGKGTRTVFVQRDNKAVRTQVQIGVTGAQFTEILSGLKEGDLLFLNDLSEFNHLSEITLR